MGDASNNCPSLQQLMGITDAADPCQCTPGDKIDPATGDMYHETCYTQAATAEPNTSVLTADGSIRICPLGQRASACLCPSGYSLNPDTVMCESDAPGVGQMVGYALIGFLAYKILTA